MKGTNGRPRGRRYAKKRHIDPPEWQGIDRTCIVCSVQNNTEFLYYNNHNRKQPRFFCHSCGNEFQLWPKHQKASSKQLANSCLQEEQGQKYSSGDVAECSTHAAFPQNENVGKLFIDLTRDDPNFVDLGKKTNEEDEGDNYVTILENELLENDFMELIEDGHDFEKMQENTNC